MPAATKLRTRIVIEKATEAQDSFGEADATWSTHVERWAAVEPQSGREFVGAQQTIPELSHLLSLRYVAGVTSKMRVRVKGSGRLLNILAVLNADLQTKDMQLACRELQ